MRADWGKDARWMIEETMNALPADANLGDRRKALKRRASEFHMGTSWGKKVWSRECRKYLQREHGLPPLSDAGPNPPKSQVGRKLLAGQLSGDIIFPFRGEGDHVVSERQAGLRERD